MQPCTLSDGISRMCYLGWACGPGHFLQSVPLVLCQHPQPLHWGCIWEGTSLPTPFSTCLWSGFLSFSPIAFWTCWCCLPLTSHTWCQAPEVQYLLCKEIFFFKLIPCKLQRASLCSSTAGFKALLVALFAAFVICRPQSYQPLLSAKIRVLSLSGVSSQGTCPITWIRFALCLLHPSYVLLVALRPELHAQPEMRAHQAFTPQQRDTLCLAFNTLACDTQRFLALFWLLMQAKAMILGNSERWLWDLLPKHTACTTFSIT